MNFSFLTLTVLTVCLCSAGALTTRKTATTAPATDAGQHCSRDTISAATASTIRSCGIESNRNSCRRSTRLSASRRDTLTTAMAAGVSFLSVSVATDANAVATTSTEAVASTKKPITTCQEPCFTGVWSDPKHPKGYRVLIRKSGTVANMFLSDGETGDTGTVPKTYNNISVKVKDNKGETYLTFDFSAKGGPKGIVASVADNGNKIIFPDGNVWTKNVATAVEGVYATDPRVAGEGYRVVVIRKDAGTNLAVQLNNDQAITAKIDDSKKKDGVGIQFVFPKNTPVDATYTNGVIKFPFPVQSNSFGNTFTKWDEWTKL